ncbi:MAG: DUF255 domain-containing protein [Desulfobacterales bacterium]|jgi:hypothetical protein
MTLEFLRRLKRSLSNDNPNSELLMCRKFTHIFTTNFVGSLDIRASREVFPIGVMSPEIGVSQLISLVPIVAMAILGVVLLFPAVNYALSEPEAFDRAKREDKPVFLSIGYSTCH